MNTDEFDFDQDLLTIQCPKCLMVGESRELILDDSDGVNVLNLLNHTDPSELGAGGPTEFVCTNCNLTY